MNVVSNKSGTDWLRAQSGKAASATPLPPACDPTEAVDAQTEAWLQSYGVRYAPKALMQITLIDEKRSRGNQVRATPIVPESVDRFVLALKEKKYLGAIVVYQDGNRAIIIDGNNRDAAHRKNGEQFIWAFVIDPDTPSEVIDRLKVSGNLRHGVTPDPKWRIMQAAYLVSAHGMRVEDAAKDAGVSPSQIRDHQATIKADVRAKSLKLSGFDQMPGSSKRDLGRVVSDPVFFQAAKVAMDTGMTSDEVKLFVREIKLLRSDAEQITHIGNVAQQRKLEEVARKTHGKSPGSISSPKNNLATAIGKIIAIDPALLARQVLTDTERQEIIRRTNLVGEKLIEIQIALEAASHEAHRDTA